MKFEKLDENKIRITLTAGDLEDKDINFHDFMSNPLETQDLFLDILEEAKEKVGFNTTDYHVKIEALAMIDGDFVVNITRSSEKEKMLPSTTTSKKKFKVRKRCLTKSKHIIYMFDSFDDYCYYIESLAKNQLTKLHTIAKEIVAYLYQGEYYLIFDNINTQNKNLVKFYGSITEFATYINYSPLLVSRLKEYGTIVIKNNAIKTSLKYYQKK